jgi:peptidoglycan hydrolase-like protein with peptidoglycan-binding domain
MPAPSSPPRSLPLRRVLVAATATALAVTLGGCQPDDTPPAAATDVAATSSSPASTSTPPASPSTTTAAPTTPTPTAPTPAPTTASPTTTTKTPPTPTRTTPAPVVLWRQGDSGTKVRQLQARLRQIRWFSGDVTNYYGSRTVAAVRGFQAKRGYPVTGAVDERTWNKLVAMTHRPTSDELNNVTARAASSGVGSWDVDKRCLTGRVMCISKSTRSLTWVIDGVPQYGFDVRFGSDELPTREGVFSIYKKKIDVISNLYHTPMPYSMFFSGGQAVHYSSNFARLGYSGASHGCVNVRNWNGIVRLYNESRIGDKVVIHW